MIMHPADPSHHGTLFVPTLLKPLASQGMATLRLLLRVVLQIPVFPLASSVAPFAFPFNCSFVPFA